MNTHDPSTIIKITVDAALTGACPLCSLTAWWNTAAAQPWDLRTSGEVEKIQSFRATSGPVIRLMSGNVEAMIASDAARPPSTVAQYAIPGMRNAMSTCEWR
jgi:hypothetical protein